MSDVTRSSAATSGVAVREVERRRKALPNGLWGMALLVATEATLFGGLFATYLYLRSNVAQWPPPGVEAPKVALPLVLNGVLALTFVPMLFAARSARAGRAAPARLLILLAFLVQAAFFGIQLHEISADLAKFSPQDTACGSIYFTMLGVHQAHVAVGLLLDAWIAGRLLGGLTAYRVTAVRAIALYWYFVIAMAICTVLIQVSPSL